MANSIFFERNRRPQKGMDHTEFSVWDCMKATSAFHRDFGGIPPEMMSTELPARAPMNGVQQELYTDLLEARAESRLPALLEQFREFIEEGQ